MAPPPGSPGSQHFLVLNLELPLLLLGPLSSLFSIPPAWPPGEGLARGRAPGVLTAPTPAPGLHNQNFLKKVRSPEGAD